MEKKQDSVFSTLSRTPFFKSAFFSALFSALLLPLGGCSAPEASFGRSEARVNSPSKNHDPLGRNPLPGRQITPPKRYNADFPASHDQAQDWLRQSIQSIFRELTENSSEPHRLGFPNLGNTCYASSALKLFWATQMDSELDSATTVSKNNSSNASSPAFGKELRSLFERFDDALELDPDRRDIPKNKRRFLDNKNPTVGYQHDSPTFLARLINLFMSQPAQSDPTTADRFENGSFLSKLLGNKRTEDSINNDGPISIFLVPILKMALPPNGSQNSNAGPNPSTQDGLNLHELIDHTFAEERLEGKDEVEASDGKKYPALKRLVPMISIDKRPPKHLFFSLKRFNNDLTKNETPVRIPKALEFNYSTYDIDHLDRSKIQMSGEVQGKSQKYTLKAGVVHTGGIIQGGHYYTYVRHSKVEVIPSQWFKHNDNHVQEWPETQSPQPGQTDSGVLEDLSQHGYYFLYERDDSP